MQNQGTEKILDETSPMFEDREGNLHGTINFIYKFILKKMEIIFLDNWADQTEAILLEIKDKDAQKLI